MRFMVVFYGLLLFLSGAGIHALAGWHGVLGSVGAFIVTEAACTWWLARRNRR